MTWSQSRAWRAAAIPVVLAAMAMVVHGQVPADLDAKEEQAFKAAASLWAKAEIREYPPF